LEERWGIVIMKAKAYLEQPYRMNLKINSQLEQLEQMRSLTNKVTSSFGEERVSGTKSRSPMESAIIRVMMAENEINRLIDVFIEIKADISDNIQKLDSFENKMLLELRYLCFNSWDEISMKMNYNISYIYKIHSRALKSMEKILNVPGGKKECAKY
jgi:hypothetical protein